MGGPLHRDRKLEVSEAVNSGPLTSQDFRDAESNPRYIAERFVNLLLEYVLGAIQSEWQPRESVSSVRRVECCVVGTFFIQLNIPVSTSGVKNGEKLSPIQLL